MADETLTDAARTLLDLATTRELPPRETITVVAAPDARALRALDVVAIGGLELGAKIGEGGMSVVYRATQVALGREVAVKILRESDAEAKVRLMREAWITGALEHPSVVPVHDVKVDSSGNLQIVLRRISGAAWAEIMHDPAALRRLGAGDPLDWNVRTLMQVCNAVHFAHSRGILHRDLKSENVMIGEFGEVYVVDWGLAVALTDDGTGRLPLVSEVDTIAGTPAYMAPEMLQASGAHLSVRTDVYLLGALLYEIVLGQPPHMGPNLPAILASIARSKPPIPEHVPAELADILRRSLAREPEARYEGAEQLRAALAAFLEHRASTALAVDAAGKLRQLEENARVATADKGSSLYDLFGECRFGFREALRAWGGNPVARDGIRRAVTAMAEHELRQGNPRAAEVLLAELEDPPLELVARVREAKARQKAEQKRLAALERDYDPRVGRRVRLAISAGLGVVWTLIPWAGWILERNDPNADQLPPLLSSTAMLVLATVVAVRARRALSSSALNRSLVRAVGVVLAGQVVLYAVTLRLGVSYEHTRVLVLCLYSACSALTAAAVEKRLWPAAWGYFAIVVASVLVPAMAWPLESLANLLLTANVMVIWRREQPPPSRR